MCDCLTHEEHLTRCGRALEAACAPAPAWSSPELRGPRGGYFRRHGRPLPLVCACTHEDDSSDAAGRCAHSRRHRSRDARR